MDRDGSPRLGARRSSDRYEPGKPRRRMKRCHSVLEQARAHTHTHPHTHRQANAHARAGVLAFGKRFFRAGPTRFVYMALAASPFQRPLTCSNTMRRSSDTTAATLTEGVPIQSCFCLGFVKPRSVPSLGEAEMACNTGLRIPRALRRRQWHWPRLAIEEAVSAVRPRGRWLLGPFLGEGQARLDVVL